MAQQLVDIPRAPGNENIQPPLTQEQALGILFEVVPHMPTESQVSFISMFNGNTSSPPSGGVPEAPQQHARLSLLPDSLHNYVQKKTIQHLSESDLAFEAKQQAFAKTSRRLGKSKGIIKRYDEPQKSQSRKKWAPRTAFPLVNPYAKPSRIPWGNGDTTLRYRIHRPPIF